MSRIIQTTQNFPIDWENLKNNLTIIDLWADGIITTEQANDECRYRGINPQALLKSWKESSSKEDLLIISC